MASKRLEFIKLLLIEADDFLMKGDVVQSSEKLYKAAEECIKALSLLEKAVSKLTNNLGIEVQLGWDAANHLHIWGFHEAKFDKEDIEGRNAHNKKTHRIIVKTANHE
ncbi:MAG: PaREP1 family protein [Candidatus Bathyarchaeia archaeon]